ncbi:MULTISPECIES: hypothetical protein [unclassified Aminobacter]|uniref:hypothetical protein n=1 Tax=unclassified Aminobacter TaxID=2644704 RepID=UPI0012EB5982|nr:MULTISPECIES: hypothetical protein [unclassified Aminobacter]
MLKLLFLGGLTWLGYVIMKENQQRRPVALIASPDRWRREADRPFPGSRLP